MHACDWEVSIVLSLCRIEVTLFTCACFVLQEEVVAMADVKWQIPKKEVKPVEYEQTVEEVETIVSRLSCE